MAYNLREACDSVKIRLMAPSDYQQVVALLQQFGDGAYAYSPVWPFRALYPAAVWMFQGLSATQQPLPYILVAVSEGSVRGLLWLSADGLGKSRWRIEQLIVHPDESALDVGKHLVAYAIHHYGAQGVRTFVAKVESACEPVLALLKASGFRHATRIQNYHLNVETPRHRVAYAAQDGMSLRLAHAEDRPALAEVYQDMLPAELRPSLGKIPKDFMRSPLCLLSDPLSGLSYHRWLAAQLGVKMAVEMLTIGYQTFHVGFLIPQGLSGVAKSLLDAALHKIYQTSNRPIIHARAYEFQKELQVAIAAEGFVWNSSTEVLVCDYWRPLEQSILEETLPLQGVLALFGGKTSPACFG
jgi:ribosomal protein S18 acetylase RimI-like enzyme